jgi:hypothetical protein
MGASCDSVGSLELADASEFPMACYSKAALLHSDIFDAKTDRTVCYFKKCGALDDITFSDKYGGYDVFTTLTLGWTQVVRAAENMTIGCEYIDSYEVTDPTEFPMACYSRAALVGSDTFSVTQDGSICYFNKCGSLADMTYTDKYGGQDVFTTLTLGWTQVAPHALCCPHHRA